MFFSSRVRRTLWQKGPEKNTEIRKDSRERETRDRETERGERERVTVAEDLGSAGGGLDVDLDRSSGRHEREGSELWV